MPWAEAPVGGAEPASSVKVGDVRIAREADPKDASGLSVGGWRISNAGAAPHGATPRHTPGEPGLLVFRRGGIWRQVHHDAPEDFLAVFLALETPTQGVDRGALSRAMALEGAVEEVFGGAGGDGRAIRVLGPSFSGTMPSLRDALLEGLAGLRRTGREYTLEVHSGAATAFDLDGFDRALKAAGGAGFRSAVHRGRSIIEEVLAYLGRAEDDQDVAILTESNTGSGSNVREPLKIKSNARERKDGPNKRHRLELQFPLHIAEIRKVYESQNILRAGAAESLRSNMEVRRPNEEAVPARDVVPDQTSVPTSLAENRVLTQLLHHLQDRRYRVIGIVATDPHDAVFLAQLISRFNPDAQIFLVGSDLMMLDPETIADLRGVLVGSTYPLFPSTRDWAGAERSARGSFFTSQHAQGTFNAAAVLMGKAVGECDRRKGLVDYVTPPALLGPGVEDAGLPPIWISVVGERALFPIECRMVAEGKWIDREYLIDPRQAAPGAGARLTVDHEATWLLALGALTGGVLVFHLWRQHQARERAGAWEGPIGGFGLALGLLLAFYSYPAFVATSANHPSVQWLLIVCVVAVYGAALWATMRRARFPSGRGRAGAVPWVAEGLVLAIAPIAMAVWAWWVGAPARLQAIRAVALTGGVSPLVPLAFVAAGYAAWAYAAHRLASMAPPASRPGAGALASAAEHRAKFDALFADGPRAPRPNSARDWVDDHKPEFLIGTWLALVLLDSIFLRPLSRSIEGWPFDWTMKAGGAALLALIGWQAARLWHAWKELKKALHALDPVLGRAFERIPNRASGWYLDPMATQKESALLIGREVEHVRSLFRNAKAEWTEGPVLNCFHDEPGSEARTKSETRDARTSRHHQGARPPGGADLAISAPGPVEFGKVEGLLDRIWCSRPVGPTPTTKSDTPPPIHDQITAALEDLVALEHARWIGGALARVWTLIGFLVVASLGLLFAVTSYPFPEQSRWMVLMGAAIGALMVVVLRVAIGASRDSVLSRMAGNDPGRITWDASLLGNLGAYVVPLVGVLAAVSFTATDFFRSVLGPILRLFP